MEKISQDSDDMNQNAYRFKKEIIFVYMQKQLAFPGVTSMFCHFA